MSYRIVVADDHALVRQGLRKIIQGAEDLEVAGEAGDGLELLALLNTMTPDMIILDISMPKLKGIDVIGTIKTKHPDIKVLILSMHKEYLSKALSAGAHGYLLKEDAERDLFSAIGDIRLGKIYISPCLREFLGEGLNVSHREPLSEPLTGREREVLNLVAAGKTNKEIAGLLRLSVRTVECHRSNMMKKLNIGTVAELVRYAISKGYS